MKRVVFIDARNAARSPIAEAFFNHLADETMHAYSCGTMPGQKIDPTVVKVMKEVGIDLRTHIPRMVNQQSLADADFVILMGKDVYPRAFSPKAIWNFQDPTGLPLTSYRELRDAIRLNVLKLVAEIRRASTEPCDLDRSIAA